MQVAVFARTQGTAVAAEIGMLAHFPAARANDHAARLVIEAERIQVADAVADRHITPLEIVTREHGQFGGLGGAEREPGGAQQESKLDGALEHDGNPSRRSAYCEG